MKIETTEDMQDMLAEDAMQLDGLDDAIIGVSTQGYIVYSYWKIVQKFISDDGMTDEEAFDNCVTGLKKIAGHAEKQNVTICLEHLNTRDDSHPMKGHPGYQGDNVDAVADMLRRVGSDNVRLLFDIYHVQIMNGDVIRRIEECKDIIGHVHTAGNPGRGELDESQEINYPAIMQKLLAIGYKGYVGQEFIPTRDPFVGLREAVMLCDVSV